jgi:hypothetical protein
MACGSVEVDESFGGRRPAEPADVAVAGLDERQPVVSVDHAVERLGERDRLRSGSSTSTAASPAISGIDPTAVATTGVPAAFASRIGNPNPSSSDG